MTRTLTLLLSLVAVMVIVPVSPGHAYSTEASPAFYARMLDQHDGVFVSEELAGYMNRNEVAEDLRTRVDEAGMEFDVLVVAHPTDESVYDLAWHVREESPRPLVVFSPNTNHVGWALRNYSGVPEEAVLYTSYTGTYPEDPRDQLDRMLRAADYPDLEERLAKAETEYIELVDGVLGPDAADPGFPTQRWLARTWPSTVGAVLTAVAVAVVVGAGVTAFRRLREAGS